MNEYYKQLEGVIRATTFHSPTSYSWFGEASPSLAPTIQRALSPEMARQFMLHTLESQLYRHFYCHGFATQEARDTGNRPTMGLTPFIEALSAANAGNGYWDDCWTVRAIEDDTVVVRKKGLELWVKREECEPDPLLVGAQIRLHRSKELLNWSPGFYVALSNRAFIGEEAQGIVRLYWNCTERGAARLIREITTALNQADLPFQVKALKNPDQFTRCDAATLYIEKSDYASVAALLARLYPLVASDLRSTTPAFTRALAPGLGLAENPGDGKSFGEHRCHIVAEGLLRAYEQGVRSLKQRLRVVEVCFAEAGLSLEKPYLNPGSDDCYHFAPSYQPHVQPSREPAPSSQNAIYLQTAQQIGQRLVHEAIWHQEQCNWMGASYWSDSLQHHQSHQIYRALGPEFYDGTSGIALFLAELYMISHEKEMRETALGAIRQALAHTSAILTSQCLGLYGGLPGIALVAARIGVLLGERELLLQAKQLAQQALSRYQEQHEFDLISGTAGAIVALLALHAMLNDASLVDIACQSGDDLLRMAHQSARGYSWKSPSLPTSHDLTGLSHGAAGVAYALLELSQVTGASLYRHAAERGFAYEHSWFDADAGNWPDFRQTTRKRRRSKNSTFGTFWCHGAPGIALTRLRAYSLLKEETYRTEATAALQTTQQTIEDDLYNEQGNFSLCHGIAGNAEVLLEGMQTPGLEWLRAEPLIVEVARYGCEEATKTGGIWRCGTRGGETPGMMLGLAGIGYFYLRLFQPTIPSILLPRHEQFLR